MEKPNQGGADKRKLRYTRKRRKNGSRWMKQEEKRTGLDKEKEKEKEQEIGNN